MKARAERMTSATVTAVGATLSALRENIDYVIKAMDETHSAKELAQDLNYCALMSASINIKQTIHDLKNWVNGQYN